jgi:hypothetical protein
MRLGLQSYPGSSGEVESVSMASGRSSGEMVVDYAFTRIMGKFYAGMLQSWFSEVLLGQE